MSENVFAVEVALGLPGVEAEWFPIILGWQNRELMAQAQMPRRACAIPTIPGPARSLSRLADPRGVIRFASDCPPDVPRMPSQTSTRAADTELQTDLDRSCHASYCDHVSWLLR